MIGVDHIGSRVGTWVDATRPFATARLAPAVTVAMLAVAAVTESSARAAVTGVRAQCRPGARPARPGQHTAARRVGPQVGCDRRQHGQRDLAGGIPHPHRGRRADSAARLVPARPAPHRGSWQAAGAALAVAFLVLALTGPSAPTPSPDPGRAAGRAGPGSRLGRDRPPGPQRGARTRRGPAGHRRHPARAHRARRTGADRPRAARRRRPPHLHDRRAGRDRPADHSRAARRPAPGGCPRSATPRGPR